MAYKEFDDEGRIKPSPYYDRVVDVMEELFKFTLLMRGGTGYLTDRYNERNERALKTIDQQIQKICSARGDRRCQERSRTYEGSRRSVSPEKTAAL
jgi:hypothetical protein